MIDRWLGWRLYLLLVVGLILMVGLIPRIGLGAPLPEQVLPQQHAQLAECLNNLPGNLRRTFVRPDLRRRALISRHDRPQWSRCMAIERQIADQEAARKLAAVLTNMVGGRPSPGVRAEANAISQRLVHATRHYADRFQMVGSPMFNNVLMHMGLRKHGYCYHWTSVLIESIRKLPWRYFTLQWGVANMGRVTENNGVLIMAKGTELSQGLIYDAWRGAGRPYWINVGEDHYRWKIRYDAASIARGVGLAHIDRATVDWSASRENDIPPE